MEAFADSLPIVCNGLKPKSGKGLRDLPGTRVVHGVCNVSLFCNNSIIIVYMRDDGGSTGIVTVGS